MFLLKLEKKLLVQSKNVIADVPISVLLSGGIDSNIILSVITKILKKGNNLFNY